MDTHVHRYLKWNPALIMRVKKDIATTFIFRGKFCKWFFATTSNIDVSKLEYFWSAALFSGASYFIKARHQEIIYSNSNKASK